MEFLIFIGWWLCGVCGYLRWTPDEDRNVMLGLVIGMLLGTMAWPIGWAIYGADRARR